MITCKTLIAFKFLKLSELMWMLNVKKVEKWLYPFQYCFKIDHPASAAYSETDWDSEGVFKKVKGIVKENNNIDITWWPKQDSLTMEQDVSPDLLF